MTIGSKIACLRENLFSIEPLPDRVASFVGREEYKTGFALFPCGSGLIDPDRSSVSTIILGSDWGNESSFNDMLLLTKHNDEKLFRNMRSLLSKSGFDVNDCFFSNAWPVLRAGHVKESGHHPMRDPGAFTERCRSYFGKVVLALNPHLVVTLGIAPAWFVGPFVGSAWKIGAYPSYDDDDIRSTSLAEQPVCAESGVTYVAITHQSIPANVRYRGMTHQDECDLLRRAREMAQIAERRNANP